MSDHIWFWQRIVSSHMAGLASALAAQGFDVTYVAERPISSERAAQGWEVPDLGAARLLFAPDAEAAKALVEGAPEGSIHICQGLRANGLVSVAQKTLATRGLRQWVIMETVDDSGWKGALKRLWYWCLILRYRSRIDGILATGHATSGWLAALGMPEERIFPFTYFLSDIVVPSILDMRSDESFRVLFVGQLIERKRLDVLIEALARLNMSKVELVVIGTGPLEHELRERAALKLGGCVTWLGLRPQSDIPRCMAEADCLVLPSRHDGWGAVVSEALMAGTPVICSDHCGAAGVVEASGCGGVFPSGDVSALASMLGAQIALGRQLSIQRAALATWARCLGAEAGAGYLAAVLRNKESGAEAPQPPWKIAGRMRNSEKMVV